MDDTSSCSINAANRGNKWLAVKLQPLVVGPGIETAKTLQTSVLTAVTPHVSVTRKLVTGRCKSNLLLRPASPPEPLRPHSQPQASLAPLQLRNRCSTAPAGLKRVAMSATTAPKLPRVLHFETWWVAAGKRHRTTVDYHTATGEFCFKGDEEVSLTMQDSSGRQLDHWDLHVGAELDMCGKKIVLKEASCGTTTWLVSWAKVLLHHKRHLEAELEKFVPVVQCRTSGLRNNTNVKPLYGLADKLDFEHGPQESEPVDGRIHLRHLRDDVAHLAWRLRQYKPVVQLPPELEDLKPPQGPAMWSIPGACLSPTVLGTLQIPEPSLTIMEVAGNHTSGYSTHRGRSGLTVVRPDSADSQPPYLPSLGQTPTALGQLSALNRANPLACLQGNPLALSAAMSRNYTSYNPLQTRPLTVGSRIPA